jgi:two-component system response regulator CitB
MATVRVLIVEDVDEMRLMIEQAITGMPGFKISGSARNVWDARVELGRRKPDIVLLDEILPGESSVDLLAEIRALGVPCLLMTGVENPNHPIPEGAAGRFVKPSWDRFDEDTELLRQALTLALSG